MHSKSECIVKLIIDAEIMDFGGVSIYEQAVQGQKKRPGADTKEAGEQPAMESISMVFELV